MNSVLWLLIPHICVGYMAPHPSHLRWLYDSSSLTFVSIIVTYVYRFFLSYFTIHILTIIYQFHSQQHKIKLKNVYWKISKILMEIITFCSVSDLQKIIEIRIHMKNIALSTVEAFSNKSKLSWFHVLLHLI